MTVRPYLRNSLARSLFDKMMKDENLRSLDKSKWYDIVPDLVDSDVRDLFVESCADEETEVFLEKCFEKSNYIFTQMFHALARSVLGWFMTGTSINGYLGRGSMFVFSNVQFQLLMCPFANQIEEWKSRGNLLDLGAGDGMVTDIMARHFRNTYVTEMSGVMRKILTSKNFTVLDVDNWHNNDAAPLHFDMISCLNLLDRCDQPLTLLHQVKSKIKPVTGLLLLGLVLPLHQYVESGGKDHKPSENIAVEGRTFEEQVSSLNRTLFKDMGFEMVTWTRLPYLCEGDLDQGFYWLNDALFVLKLSDVTAS